MLRVECIPRCNAMRAGFVLKIKRQFSVVLLLNIVPFCHVCGMPVCLPQCVLAVALPGLSLTSPSCLKMSFTEIVKPLTAR